MHHVDHLAAAADAGHPDLFIKYLHWARTLLKSYNVHPGDLDVQLETLSDVIAAQISPPDVACHVTGIIKTALSALPGNSVSEEVVCRPAELSALARAYLDCLLRQDTDQAIELVSAAASSGIPLKTLYLDVVQTVQHEVGRLWQSNQISVAQEHYSTSVAQTILGHLYTMIPKPLQPANRTAVCACISNEQHDLGMRIVSDFLYMSGWKSLYLGSNTPTDAIIAAIRHHNPQLLALSVTSLPHLQQLKSLVERVRQEPAPDLKIIVGGYPFNVSPELWTKVGADGHARDANGAAEWANEKFPEF